MHCSYAVWTVGETDSLVASEGAGHRARYVFSGGLNKEVKWMLMHKNGVEEEQEEDYAIVWDWFSKVFVLDFYFCGPQELKDTIIHVQCSLLYNWYLIFFMTQLCFQSMLHFHGVTWDYIWIIKKFLIKLVRVYQVNALPTFVDLHSLNLSRGPWSLE